MNIIEHLTRTVTPILLNNTTDANRASLLEKLYAILVARLADGNVSNSFANATIADNDHSFFDRVLPDASHRTGLVQQLSKHYNVPEQEAGSLVSRAAPLVMRELRSLAGTTPLNTFLSNNISSIATVIPSWAYAFIPAGILSMMNLSPTHAATTPTTPVVKTATRTEEHLVATPKREEGGLMKMLLPIIGLLILGALAWALLKSCNKTEPVATPVVASTTASTPTTEVSAASATANMATVAASTVTINAEAASMPAASENMPMGASSTAMTTDTTATTISSTEPSVVFENGRLSFYFATGKAQVAGNAKEKANDILEAAKQGKKIGISGYTDSTGNAATNAKLVKERAQAVKAFLVANGVPNSQLELIKPQDTTGAAGKDQEGRRVDAYIVDDNAIPATGTTTVVASPAN